jgi:hypothetical protein
MPDANIHILTRIAELDIDLAEAQRNRDEAQQRGDRAGVAHWEGEAERISWERWRELRKMTGTP